MKILHVITGLTDGGAEAVLSRLCAHDAESHHTVVSLMDDGKYGPLLRQDGVAVYSLGMSRGRVNARALLRLWRLIRAEQADLVQTWMYHADLLGGILARLAGVRVVWGIHHSTLEPGKSKQSTIKVAKVCALLSRFVPTRIICCSQRAAEIHKTQGYAADKLRVIPNGYDLSQFRPNESARTRLRNEWAATDDLPVVGMVARFNPQKDHFNLISALGKLKRAEKAYRCILIGAAIKRDNTELIDAIRAEDIEDLILLYEHRSDIADVMNALDIHILSSAYGEAFPNVLCEAMACGTPCITTDVGDAALIVGESGWVVPPSNSEALAQGLIAALNEWTLGTTWSNRQISARRRILENFTVDQMVQSYRAVWCESL